MTSNYNRAWMAYENELCLAHQLKLLRPPPEPEESISSSLSDLLYWQSRLVQEARDVLDHYGKPDELDGLDLIASQLIDCYTHLNSREILLCTSHLHHSPFMAAKVKGLKALRGVGPKNRRTTIMRALSAVIRKNRLVGFGGPSALRNTGIPSACSRQSMGIPGFSGLDVCRSVFFYSNERLAAFAAEPNGFSIYW